MDSVLLDSLRLALTTVQTNGNRKMRRMAATSLLYCLQDIESPVAYQSVSLAEQLNTFTWFDPTGMVVIPPAMVSTINATTSQSSPLSANGNRRYHEEFRNHLSRVSASSELARLLREWWRLMSTRHECSGDQVYFECVQFSFRLFIIYHVFHLAGVTNYAMVCMVFHLFQ